MTVVGRYDRLLVPVTFLTFVTPSARCDRLLTSSQVESDPAYLVVLPQPVMVEHGDLQAAVRDLRRAQVVPGHGDLPPGGGGPPTHAGLLLGPSAAVREQGAE